MKKTIWLTVSAIIFICSGLLFCGGMSQLSWDFKKLDSFSPYTSVNKDFVANEVSTIKVDTSISSVTIKETVDDKITVSGYDSEIYKFIVELNEGVLLIKKNVDHKNWLENLFKKGFFTGTNHEAGKVFVGVPKGFVGNLEIDCEVGDLLLENLNLASLKIVGSTTDITLISIDCPTIDINVKAGDIKLNNVSTKDLKIISSTGTIKLDNVTADGLKLVVTTGTINFDNLTANNLDLKCTSGDIRGNLIAKVGEYNVSCSTSIGDSNLAESFEQSRTKNLKAVTSTGSIYVYFVDKL